MELGVLVEEYLEERDAGGGRARGIASARAHLRGVLASMESELGRSPELPDWTRVNLRRALLAYRDRGDLRYAEGGAGERQRSSSSVRLRLTHVRGFTRWLRDQELVSTDPLRGLVTPSGERSSRPAPLTSEEVAALIQGAESGRASARDRLLVLVLAGAGCTLEEAAGLRVDDVELAGGVLRTGGRELGLTPRLREAVESYLPVRAGVVAGAGGVGGAGEWLLHTGGSETVEARARSLAKALRRAGERAGIEAERTTASQLRASFAQLGLESGMSVASCCQALGISITALRRLVVMPEERVSLSGHPLA